MSRPRLGDELLELLRIMLTPTAKSPTAAITVNDQPVLSGMASQTISLSFGMNPITVEVTAHSGKKKRYDVLVTRASSIEYIKASNTGQDDFFGISVALSDDTLVVGAPREDSSATGVNGNQTSEDAENSGAVYVFTRSGATWAQQAYLKASNRAPTTSSAGVSRSPAIRSRWALPPRAQAPQA